MEFKATKVYNFEGAIRGMRNPLNSWDKSDSYCGLININNPPSYDYDIAYTWVDHERKQKGDSNFTEDDWDNLWGKYDDWLFDVGVLSFNEKNKKASDTFDVAFLGPNDLGLAQRLINSGPEHAKFLRQIFVSVDITAPIYWWKEADTYKIGTTANSTSTMHKLASNPITKEMFEWDDGKDLIILSGTATHGDDWERTFEDYKEDIVQMCENLRQKYLETKDKSYWRALVQMLPQSWLQTRTWTTNYAVLRNIYFQRKNHKLKEWHQFCDWVKTLPYGKELITLGDKNEN